MGGARAGPDIRSRAGDRARGGDAARDRAKNIRDSLRHQLLVGIVPRIGHAIGHHCGEKRFDCAQRGDGEGRPHQIAHRLESYGREMQTRQARWNAAKPAIDGCHRPAGEISDQRCRCHRDNACRHAPG